MSEETIYHLFGPGLSGRAVKMRELNPDDNDELEAEAVRDMKANGFEDHAEFSRLLLRGSLTRMIVAVTAPGVGVAEGNAAREAAIKTVTEAAKAELEALQAGVKDGTTTAEALSMRLAALTVEAHAAGKAAAEQAAANALLNASWIPTSTLDLQTKGKAHYFATLFKVKEAKLLGIFYRREYSALEGEASEIMGKALKVA